MSSRLRWFSITFLLAIGIVAIFLLRRPQKRPDVILISIDTCRADRMGFNGGARFTKSNTSPTPHLDQLSLRALPIREALSPVPLTLPAHTSLFSGLLPDAHGVRENDSFEVPAKEVRGYSLLAEDLRAVGYATAAFVSGQPLEKVYGLRAGFEVYEDPSGDGDPKDEHSFRERDAADTTDRVLRYLATRTDQPLFLFVHYFDPHHPYEPRLGFSKETDDDAARYLGEIQHVDREIGRLLAALPKSGEEALIIVVSDHGEGLSEHGELTHGHLLHDATLKVPFLLKPPKSRPVRVPGELPARLIDVYPTILDVTGVTPIDPTPRDGVSLQSRSTSEWYSEAETLYSYYQFQYAALRSVHDAEHKLHLGGGVEELFQWRRDPNELVDLAAGAADVRRALRLHLEAASQKRIHGQALERDVEHEAANPYTGSRIKGRALEPSTDENAKLPHVSTKWEVVAALDRARAAIHGGRPAEAEALLARFESERDTNPSLLFWSARASDLVGRDPKLSKEARVHHFDKKARPLYERHLAQFGDSRSFDAILKLLLERHAVLGENSDLEEVVRLATGEIHAGKARTLTYVFRAQAYEGLGNLKSAYLDFEEAARRNPGDRRLSRDRDRLKSR